MRLIPFAVFLLGFGLPASATPPAAKPAPEAMTTSDAGKACVDSCSTDQDRCMTRTATDPDVNPKDLCATGFKVCIERCDPHYLNYNRTIISHPVKSPDAPAISKMTPAEQCASNCGASAKTCDDAGNDAHNCDAVRRSCLSRCGTSR